jgi:hypothetical protein
MYGRGAGTGQSVAQAPPLGQKVVGVRVQAPDWFELHFANGVVLRILDDSRQYESFSIQPGDIFV